MMTQYARIAAVFAAALLGSSSLLFAVQDVHWPSFRGDHARGIAEGFETPVEWSVPDGKNIAWRTRIPGLGHSSPIVWGDRIFVTSAVRSTGSAELKVGLYGAGDSVDEEGEHAFRLYCLDKQSGKILWERTAHEGIPMVKRHPKSTHANPTPAADADHVLAFFGSEGLYCYDHDGELLWQKDLGKLDAGAPGQRQYQWGYASSPLIHEGQVIVQCDVQDQSFLVVLALADGSEVWRVNRDEDSTWSTPNVHPSGAGGRPQIVVNGYKHIGGYDLVTGEEVWKLVGGGDIPVPTPVFEEDLIFITSAHGRLAPIYAILAGAEGELTMNPGDCEYMAWSHARRGIYMQTPLVYDGILYCCNDGGILGCYDIASGEELYRERLGDGNTGFSASAVAADGKLYFSAEDGGIHVVQAGPEFVVLAVNDLGETNMATPAISEGRLYFRTRGHIVAVGAEE
ncbi:MAG: pyrrolo-quinoline quinone [Planctomycetota bacterium]|nr:MAG: pyrrolo-quinoline quinone [Planctomycetota bacterium]